MRILTERSGACLDLDVLRRLRVQSEHDSTSCIVGEHPSKAGRDEMRNADLSEGVDALEGAEEALCHGVPKSKKPNKLEKKKAEEKEGAEGGLASLSNGMVVVVVRRKVVVKVDDAARGCSSPDSATGTANMRRVRDGRLLSS